jgi:hypothetical protein
MPRSVRGSIDQTRELFVSRTATSTLSRSKNEYRELGLAPDFICVSEYRMSSTKEEDNDAVRATRDQPSLAKLPSIR